MYDNAQLKTITDTIQKRLSNVDTLLYDEVVTVEQYTEIYIWHYSNWRVAQSRNITGGRRKR